MNLQGLTSQGMRIPLVVATSLLLFAALGILLGSGSISIISSIGLTLGAVLYAVVLYRYTWQAILFVCGFSVIHVGLGFMMRSTEISCFLSGLVILVTSWHKTRIERPKVLNGPAWEYFNFAVWVWLLFGLIHSVYSHVLPYDPTQYSVRSAAKTILWWFAPPAFLLCFLNRPRGLIVRGDWPIDIMWILFYSTSLNVVLRLIEMRSGAWSDDVLQFEAVASLTFFAIPVVGLVADVFALRVTPQVTATFALVLIGTQYMAKQKLQRKLMVVASYVVSLLGAALSGGRSGVVIILGLTLIVMLSWRKFGLVILGVVVIVLSVAFVNILAPTISALPNLVKRPLQWLIIKKDYTSSISIKSSSDWRYKLAMRAVKEWQRDARSFWFGRSVYSYGEADERLRAIDPEANSEISLRRGATHSATTDLLLTYGIVGTILYVNMMIALLLFNLKLFRDTRNDHELAPMCLGSLLVIGQHCVIAPISGSFIPFIQFWPLVVTVAAIYARTNSASANSMKNFSASGAPVFILPDLKPRKNLKPRKTVRSSMPTQGS